jgi:copper transport protein
MTPSGGVRTGRRHRRVAAALGRGVQVALLLAAVVVGTASAASAHDSIERSDPPNGGMVAIGRTELTLWFGEPVEERGSSFAVRRTDPAAASLRTTATLGRDDGTVRLATPPLERGTYTITWAVVGDDGHPTGGTITFGAGLRPAGATPEVTAGPGPWGAALRLVDLGGLLVAIGAVAVCGRVLGALGAVGGALRPRVLGVGAAAALASVVAAVATPVLRTGDLLGSSSWGRLWLLRIAVAAVAAVFLWRSVQGRPARAPGARRPDPLVLAAIALVASAALDAWTGHASTLPARTSMAVLATTLHVTAAGVWTGGLVVVLVGLRPLTRLSPMTRRGIAPAAWRAFSPMAAVAAGVMAATGVYLAGRQVESLSTLSASTYGTAVVAKVLLLVTALAIASYTTLVVNPPLADRLLGRRVAWRPLPRRLATTVTAEVVVLSVAVAVAALMTTVPTARETFRAGALSAPVHATVDGFFVTFEAVPTGSSQRLVVRTQPVVRPVVSPVTAVEVGVVAPAQPGTAPSDVRLALRETEVGKYEGALTDPPGADWTATVVLHRTGRPDTVVVVPWSTGSATAATSLERVTSALSVLLLTALGSVVVLVASHRRRTRRATTTDAGGVVNQMGRPADLTHDTWRPSYPSDTDTLTLPRHEGSHP